MSDNKKENQLSQRSYRIIRLVNGEKIIAKITGSNKDKLYLDRPMIIEGIIGTQVISPIHMVKKEFLILQNWIEFCKNNNVGIPRNQILAIYAPDDMITKAYDIQKLREDTGNNDMQSFLDDASDSGLNNFEISKLLDDIVGGDISEFYCEEEENDNWSESNVDKDRSDYGNEPDDWSPFIEDYFDY